MVNAFKKHFYYNKRHIAMSPLRRCPLASNIQLNKHSIFISLFLSFSKHFSFMVILILGESQKSYDARPNQ